MVVNHTRVIACTDSETCFSDFLTRLGHGAGFNLVAASEGDTVHGSLTIVHNQSPAAHDLIVELYDSAEAANDEHHTALAVTDPFPTEQDIKDDLDSA